MKPSIVFLRSNAIRPDSRVEKEVACLVEAGYRVVILAWDRDSDHKPVKEVLTAFGVDIPIIRFGIKARFGAGLKTIRQFMLFQFALYRWLKKNRTRYDIIHACDFDTALTASWIQKRYKKKLVFDIFDFLAGEPKNFFQKLIKQTQIRLINRADATIICTEKRKKQIRDANPKKLCVIHNTPPVVSFENNIVRNTDSIRVCYVGILQEYRLLEIIPQFFIENPKIEFHVGGFGKFEQMYSDLADKYPNIKFYGRIPYEETLKLERSCDIMLAIYDPALENHRFAAPNKFYESLNLAKPVIMVKGTGMSEVVSEYNIGETIDYSLDGFTTGMKQLISKREQWPAMAERMYKIYKEQFNWAEMKIRLLALYSSL